MKFVGLDIGTTTIGGVVLDVDSQAVVGSVVKANSAALNTGRVWEKVQNPKIIFEIASGILNDFYAKYPDIKGIGITGQMHGVLYLDQWGNAVSPLYTWQDGRGDLPYQDGLTYAQYLSVRTRSQMATGYGLTTHFYNSLLKLLPKEADCLCTIGDYVAMKLANRNRPACDPTNAASLGLFNLKELVFDQAALAKTGIDPQILPQLTLSCEAIGETAMGSLVFPAIGDNQASFIGAVGERDASLLVNIGTGSQVSAFTDQFGAISGIESRPFPGGGYLLVGAPLCGGKSYALLERFFSKTLRLFAAEGPSDLYAVMNQIEANPSEATDSLKVSTKFNGTRSDPGGRGSISNISLANFLPENLIGGFLRGMVAEMVEFYNLFPPSISKKASVLVGSGNGVRKNQLLRKILVREFQREFKIPLYEEEASLGAALLAATGGGYFEDLKAAMGWVVKYQ
jgi:sedoheptulokinase